MSHGNAAMRARSGNVQDDRLLVAFLYRLARDRLPCGYVEEVLTDLERLEPGTEIKFTNGWLARWAQDAADRLADDRPCNRKEPSSVKTPPPGLIPGG